MLRQAYAEYFDCAEDCSIEYRILRPDGEIRWVRELLVAHQLRLNGKVGLSRGVIQDITARETPQVAARAAGRRLVNTTALANSDPKPTSMHRGLPDSLDAPAQLPVGGYEFTAYTLRRISKQSSRRQSPARSRRPVLTQ